MPDSSPLRSRSSGSRRSSLPDRSVDLLVVVAVTAAAVMPMPFLARARGLERPNRITRRNGHC
ncbi:MAG TPA: hypothetical protein VFR67_09675 [Pilimelia sp.]|nr:hypothetical protein [Pilimelia sp.]